VTSRRQRYGQIANDITQAADFTTRQGIIFNGNKQDMH
jgi:hypothetical protein